MQQTLKLRNLLVAYISMLVITYEKSKVKIANNLLLVQF